MKLTYTEWASLLEILRNKWLAKEYTTREYCEAMHTLCIDCKIFVIEESE
jgi:hypothetical protein